MIFFGVFTGEFKTEATTTLLDHLRTDVRGHDDQCVLEINGAALGIGEAPVFQQLQKQIEHIRVSLFDFIKKNHGVRPASHRLRQLPSFIEAHIARRRTDQFADGMPLHEFRHVEADHGLLTAEEIGGESFGQLGFADTGGA